MQEEHLLFLEEDTEKGDIDMINTTPLPPKKIRAVQEYPVLPMKKIMSLIRKNCGTAYISERHGKGNNKVIILPEAACEFQVMVSYGRRSPMNVLEQKYAGFGHFLRDEHNNIVLIVSHFIEIQTMNRNSIGASNLGPNGENNPGLDFLMYHRDEFIKNEHKFNTDAYGYKVDPFLDICGPSVFIIEGHTHPDLGVFYSGTDRQSGMARAAVSPVCIFVCDPIRKQMLGSIGKDFKEAEIIVFSRRVNDGKSILSDNKLETPQEIIGEIIRLANKCFSYKGYSGKINDRTSGGKEYLSIKMIIPKSSKE